MAELRNTPVARKPAGKVLPYAAEQERCVDPEKVKNLQAPLVLVAGGLLVHVGWAFFTTPQLGVLPLMTAFGIRVVLGSAIMMLAVFFAARQRGFQFGSFSTAIPKLLAIAIAPSALATLLALPLDYVPLGFLIVWIVEFCIYFALLGFFFDLDQEDTWYCVVVIFLARIAVALAIYFIR